MNGAGRAGAAGAVEGGVEVPGVVWGIDERVGPGTVGRVPRVCAAVVRALVGGVSVDVTGRGAELAEARRLAGMCRDLVAGVRAESDFAVVMAARVAAAGVSQFVVIGSGFQGPVSVDASVRSVLAGSHVLYVDADPQVVRAGRTRRVHGQVDVVRGDVRDPGEVMWRAVTSGLIDAARPVGLVLCGVLETVTGQGEAVSLVQGFARQVAPGSHLVASHLSTDPLSGDPGRVGRLLAGVRDHSDGIGPLICRTHDQVVQLIEAFAPGRLLDPGVAPVASWLPNLAITEPDDAGADEGVGATAGATAGEVDQPDGPERHGVQWISRPPVLGAVASLERQD